MKFQAKLPDALKGQEFECDYCVVSKKELGRCCVCDAMTSWRNHTLNNLHCCSEECCGTLWDRKHEQAWFVPQTDVIEEQRRAAAEEMVIASRATNSWKDILVVVHDQLDYFRNCVISLRESTTNFNLYVWDNASQPETVAYLDSLMAEYQGLDNPNWTLTVVRSEENVGFIKPNNELAAMGSGEYIICLNSDTKVFPKWDLAMMGFLQEHENVVEVGFGGGLMNPEGQGFGTDFGHNIDYVQGWCLCLSRKTYEEFGLFNKQLLFAYCEDADLSLRLKEAGKQIYGLHLLLVYHYQNKTVDQVHAEKQIDMESTFAHNHEYMKSRWKNYIDNERVLYRQRKQNAAIP